MGKEEYPLLPTEEYRCLDRQRNNKERNTAVVNDQQQEKDIVKRNGRDGTRKYERKNESGRRRKIDESSSGK